MSMTVNAANYMSSTYQSTVGGASDKPEQKDSTEKAGKVQQSSVSASLDQVDMGKDGITITQVSRPQGAETAASQQQAKPSRMDTVEISEEGKKAVAGKQQTAPAGETAGEYEVEDLSEYTDSELKQMYYKGEITRQEYEDETGESLD